jgi:hypothetical protein
LLAGLPFLDMSLVTQADFDLLVGKFLCDRPTYRPEGDGGGYSMSLQSQRELEATREKLRLLEERYEAAQREKAGDEHVRELSMRSLRRLINQLKEEIARFESRSPLKAEGG